jgi:L-aspartate oxidase
MPLGHGAPRQLVVVGSGVAGLTAALSGAELGAEVVLVTKAGLEDSNSMLAQGGYAAVLPEGERTPGDTVASHVADTLAAGGGLGSRRAVELMCRAAAGSVADLGERGVAFDRGADGRFLLGLEAAHAFPRILHAGGDASGAGITRALIARLRRLAAEGRIAIRDNTVVTEILLDSGAVCGVAARGRDAGGEGTRRIAADAVVLATGGAGQLFAQTTNPAVATGDGVAIAYRAGAVLRDLEFYQFHPTALQVAGPDGTLRSSLISEAVRGEGAVIRDAAGRRFVADYHPLGELAPRDAVSRAIALHARAGGGQAYLDATGLEAVHGGGFLARRFPSLDAMTRAAGFDWRREPLPIGPAAHYWMGGVATDTHGATSVPGLYAVGEVACTGVHGANRLASNSLLEGVVFAGRAVQHAVSEGLSAGPAAGVPDGLSAGFWDSPDDAAPREVDALPGPDAETLPAEAGRALVASAMQADGGVIRDGSGLARLSRTLRGWTAEDTETAHLLMLGRLLTDAAAAREESIGAHFRLDFPDRRLPAPLEAGPDAVRSRAVVRPAAATSGGAISGGGTTAAQPVLLGRTA